MEKTMKAMQVKKAGGDFQLVEIPVPAPKENEVLIKVEACGICHSDAIVKEGWYPNLPYPLVPGHEVIGTITEVGKNVKSWQTGQRVGVGWHGGHCFECEPCRRGDFINCVNGKVPGINYNGGYAEYMCAPQDALASVPKELNSEEAAPLLCAGITTYNALRNSGAKPGDTVAIQGIGGLGHLAVQFANAAGYRTVAISHGSEKRELALKLGAHIYIDASKSNAAEELQKIGGADIILATAPNSKVISEITNGLKQRGKLIIVAAANEPMEVIPFTLISGKTIQGWPSGDARDSEDTMNFSVLKNIRPQIEVFPLEKANEAYNKMITNKVRFRAVLKMQ
jgi:alcohol dehydrogenase/propanol-preferring alcohol dehydrogenase